MDNRLHDWRDSKASFIFWGFFSWSSGEGRGSWWMSVCLASLVTWIWVPESTWRLVSCIALVIPCAALSLTSRPAAFCALCPSTHSVVPENQGRRGQTLFIPPGRNRSHRVHRNYGALWRKNSRCTGITTWLTTKPIKLDLKLWTSCVKGAVDHKKLSLTILEDESTGMGI